MSLPFRNRLRSWRQQSHDIGFLVRAVLVVLLAFGLAGIVLRACTDRPDADRRSITDLIDSLQDTPVEGLDPHRDVDIDIDIEALQPRLEAHQHLVKAKEARDWWAIAYWVARIDLMDLGSPLLILSLVAGLVWAIIAAQFAGFARSQLALYGLALALGFVSATLTLLVVVLQDMRGFTEGDSFASQMIFWIAGVGLREEAIKLLCFAPLLVFLRRRREIDALVCGAMVGLGFAIQENVTYYMTQGVTDAYGRMMTANFLHLALTAFAGRALYRMVQAPRRHWEECLGTFLAVVVLHGLYDAFISMPELQGFNLASFIILAVISFRYSSLVKVIGRTGSNLAVAPVAVFVVGLAVLTGCVYLFACLYLTPAEAIVVCGESLIGLFPIAVVYLHQLHQH